MSPPAGCLTSQLYFTSIIGQEKFSYTQALSRSSVIHIALEKHILCIRYLASEQDAGGSTSRKLLQAGLDDSSDTSSSASSYTGTDNSTFLRGTTLTDNSGVATFYTIVPGWYEGELSWPFLVLLFSLKTGLKDIAYE